MWHMCNGINVMENFKPGEQINENDALFSK